MKKCSFQNCDQMLKVKGLCIIHYDRLRHLKHKDKRNALCRARYEKNKEKHKKIITDNLRKRRYNITPEQYQDMLLKQNNKCKACGNSENLIKGKKYGLSVDHCHETGKIRALLCNGCNLAVGHLKESIEIAYKVFEYIKWIKQDDDLMVLPEKK